MDNWISRLADSDWLFLQFTGRTLQQLVCHLREIPSTVQRTWLRRLLLGWLVSLIVVLLLNVLVRGLLQTGALQSEQSWQEQLSQASPWKVVDLIPLGFAGSPWVVIPLVIVSTTIAVWLRAPLHALSILASFFMAELLLLTAWNTWDRPRPEFLYGGMFASDFSSFLSGHVLHVISVYGFLAYLWMANTGRRLEQLLAALLFLLLVGATALERLALGRHWISDVVVAVLVGFLWLTAVVIALRRAQAMAGRRRL